MSLNDTWLYSKCSLSFCLSEQSTSSINNKNKKSTVFSVDDSFYVVIWVNHPQFICNVGSIILKLVYPNEIIVSLTMVKTLIAVLINNALYIQTKIEFMLSQQHWLCSILLTACETLASRSQRQPQQCGSWRRRVWAEGPACWDCSWLPPPCKQGTPREQRGQTLTGTADQQRTITETYRNKDIEKHSSSFTVKIAKLLHTMLSQSQSLEFTGTRFQTMDYCRVSQPNLDHGPVFRSENFHEPVTHVSQAEISPFHTSLPLPTMQLLQQTVQSKVQVCYASGR